MIQVRKHSTTYISILAAFLMAGLLVGCQSDSQQSDQRETTASVDTAAIQQAMTDYIHEQGDSLTVDGQTVSFDYLHESLKTKNGMYLSCADFKAPSGDVYDIDYYVEASDGEPTVQKVVYHKKNEETINETLWTRAQN